MMADGLMSQAIANVRTAQEEVQSITGLPEGAVGIQSHMVATLDTMIPAVTAASAAVLRAANEAMTPLAAADAAVEAGDAAAMKESVASLQAILATETATVDAAIALVQSAFDAVTADNQLLAGVGADLAGQITRASAEADEASHAADDLDRQKWWFLLLGPLGLPGLATCIGLIVDANNKVNTMRQRVSELRGQSAQWTKIQADLDLLRHDVPVVTGTLLSLQSGLQFLGGDTTEVVADVNRASGSHIAKAFLLAARHQLTLLMTDAS